jgi:chemotaxis receptor (MCP) glutamine deamidase CheD
VSRRAKINIQIGGVFASREPIVIGTVLGSCIAACLWDPVTGIGGMNHFMLPGPPSGTGGEEPCRYGVQAMELLIGNIQTLGGERARLEAKVFGGGHVLQIRESDTGVPQLNIRFIREFLRLEGIPLLAQDLGGYAARHVLFDTASGTARVKRLSSCAVRATKMERAHQQSAHQTIQSRGGITLFDDEIFPAVESTGSSKGGHRDLG